MKSIWFGLFIVLLLVFVNMEFIAAQPTKTSVSATKAPLKITQAAIATKVTKLQTAVPVITQKPSTVSPTTLALTTKSTAALTSKPTASLATGKPTTSVPVSSIKPTVTTAAKSG